MTYLFLYLGHSYGCDVGRPVGVTYTRIAVECDLNGGRTAIQLKSNSNRIVERNHSA